MLKKGGSFSCPIWSACSWVVLAPLAWLPRHACSLAVAPLLPAARLCCRFGWATARGAAGCYTFTRSRKEGLIGCCCCTGLAHLTIAASFWCRRHPAIRCEQFCILLCLATSHGCSSYRLLYYVALKYFVSWLLYHAKICNFLHNCFVSYWFRVLICSSSLITWYLLI
jgi:hypothetical protein